MILKICVPCTKILTFYEGFTVCRIRQREPGTYSEEGNTILNHNGLTGVAFHLATSGKNV